MLYALRFLLGVAEAGFFPGIILFLTYWFPQKDRTRIVALFMLAIPLSSAIGAPVSSWIISTGHGLFGLEGWRTMFLFEGIPAVIFGVICWFYLTDRPRDAHWMPDDERHALVTAMDADEEAKAARYEVSVKDSLTRPRVWALAFVYFGGVYGLYALGFFLPTIIKGFETQYNVSYGIVERGFINAIPYVLGAVAMYVWSRHGDRTRERVWHVALPLIVGGVAIPVDALPRQPVRRDGRREHLRHRDHGLPAVLLGAADDVPVRGGRGQRDRADQLGGQPVGVRRALHHRRGSPTSPASSGPGSGSSAGPWWRRPSSRSSFAPPLSPTRKQSG